jgi:hypothetical protein
MRHIVRREDEIDRMSQPISNTRYLRMLSQASLQRLVLRVHRDQQGSISIASVFALLLLVFLLGMIMNSGRQVDQKVKMQGAADASTYAGGVVFTRGMNTLTFTNHLLFDVFALTAYMREARDQSAQSLTPDILEQWIKTAPEFGGSKHAELQALATAIPPAVGHEREMIRTFSAWSAAASELMLPVLEEILENRRIPEFQRALVESTPRLAQVAADEVARRHGQAWPGSQTVELRAVLWRTDGNPVGGNGEAERRTLPVVDPVMDMPPNREDYMDLARSQRLRYARTYLGQWNSESLRAFDVYAQLSQFSNLWRIFTCGQLEYLLEEEYPDTNLPHLIRDTVDDIDDLNTHLERDFMFVGVVYREKIDDRIPGIFTNPIETDTQAYAQMMLFVPRRRLIMAWRQADEQQQESGENLGSVPGESVSLPLPGGSQPPPPAGSEDQVEWYVARQSGRRFPTHWDLISQNWTTQMVPATTRALAEILSTSPSTVDVEANPPNLRNLTEDDIRWISNH